MDAALRAVRLWMPPNGHMRRGVTAKLLDLTERYCVIAQTLNAPPSVELALVRE